jgi:hypothetical protein
MMDGMNNGMNNGFGAWDMVCVGLSALSFSGLLFG